MTTHGPDDALPAAGGGGEPVPAPARPGAGPGGGGQRVYRVKTAATRVQETAEPPDPKRYVLDRKSGVYVHRSSSIGRRLARRQRAADEKIRETLKAQYRDPNHHLRRANERRKAEKEARRAAEAAREAAAEVEVGPAAPDPVPPPASDAEVLRALRAKGEADLFFFIAEVLELGHNPANPDGPRVTEEQRELCDWLQAQAERGDKRVRFVLMPRNTLKTTVLEGYVIWRFSKDPTFRCLLYGEVHDQAKARLSRIKSLLDHCKTYRLLYGDQSGKRLGLTWNENAITIAARAGLSSVREDTIETAGLDVTINARHYDEIIADDLESDTNTKTRKAIDGIIEKIQLLLPLADKGAKLTFAGTFWTDGDAYVWLLDTQAAHVAEFRRSIYLDDGVTPRFPYMLPTHEIEWRRSMLRRDIFACQYLLDPVPREDAIFKEEYFTRIPRSAVPDGTRTYLLVDQAGDPTSDQEAKRDSDYTGMVVIGVTPAQDLIVMDAYHGRVNPTEAVEQALVFVERHQPRIIGIERAGVGNLAFFMREALRRKGQWGVVEDVMPQGRSKYQRVMEMEPIARRRKMYLCEGAQGLEEFLNEITRFPKGKHDDIVDATAYVLDLIAKYGTPAAPGTADTISPRLEGLNATSKAYWYAHHKAEQARRERGHRWAEEFV